MEYGAIRKAVEGALERNPGYTVIEIQNWVEGGLGVRPDKGYVKQIKRNFEFKKGKGKRKGKGVSSITIAKGKAPPFTVKTYRKVDGKAASTEAWTVNVSNGDAVTEALPNVFDVASRIADAIRGADKEVRERAFRWAKESVDGEANNAVHAG